MRFKTVFQPSKEEFTEKKSRFIGMAYPVESEEEVLEILEKTRKQYWDASHNGVYAYTIGAKKETSRFSDDGEPVHTAGLPILTILQNEGLHNVLIVVVRYFGGTLLGTGGLVRAYSQAASLALEAAGVIEKRSFLRTSVTMDYTLLGRMQYGLLQEGYTIEDTLYTDRVEMKLLVPEEEKDVFCKKLTELSDGKMQPQFGETVLAAEYEGQWHYYEQPIEGES